MPILAAGMTKTERAQIISPRTIRRVWDAVTRTPHASYRELAAQLNMPTSTIRYAMERLRDAGYITWEPGASRTLRIIVPFIAVNTRKVHGRTHDRRADHSGADQH